MPYHHCQNRWGRWFFFGYRILMPIRKKRWYFEASTKRWNLDRTRPVEKSRLEKNYTGRERMLEIVLTCVLDGKTKTKIKHYRDIIITPILVYVLPKWAHETSKSYCIIPSIYLLFKNFLQEFIWATLNIPGSKISNAPVWLHLPNDQMKSLRLQNDQTRQIYRENRFVGA